MFKCLNLKIKERGVVLYLALIMMTIFLAIGLGLTVIVVSQLKMIRNIGDSVVAFYAADTGVERVLYEDKMCHQSDLSYCDPSCWGLWLGRCEGLLAGSILGSLDTQTNYEAKFNNGAVIITSVGDYNGTKRAVEVSRIVPKRVFVSSLKEEDEEGNPIVPPIPRFTGNLGGLSGADAQCQTLADSAGLTGIYKAWLSDGTDSPSDPDLFTHNPGPYERIDGVIVADNWDDLITEDDGTGNYLKDGISVDENGVYVPFFPLNYYVWTNTNPDGTKYSDTDHCFNWMSDSPLDKGELGLAHDDIFSAVWTIATTFTCDTLTHLYCFQQ